MVPVSDRPRIRILILLLRRLGTGFLTAFAALTLTFFILRLVGSDPVDTLLAQGLTSLEQAEQLRKDLGLDQPILNQYASYLAGLFQGDLGASLYTRRSVLQSILEQFRWTLELAFSGLVVGILGGLLLGISASWWRKSSIGAFAATLASLLTAVPVAFLGIVALWISSKTPTSIPRTILPTIVLGITISGPMARLILAHLSESLEGPYILAARARGIRRSFRLLWHALRPILPPLLSLIALEAAFLFAGTVVTETVFSRPGLGRLMVRAILEGDYPVTQGLVTLAALFYTGSHIIADWLALLFDPRLRELS
jgi:peptide/nickel transport system permease protein